MNMNITNYTDIFDNESLVSSLASENQCPRQRAITRPLLFVHNYSLFFFGSIFNFLAFIILIQRSLRCHSTFAYLAFLSLSNGLLSLVHFSKWMFNYYFDITFETYLISCRFHRFSSDFLTHFSLFTLICVNIDRARTVTTNRPNTKYSKSKFHMVLIKECLVASILCAFHFHWIIKYGYEVSDGKNKEAVCYFDDNQESFYNYFLAKIYPPFELVVFFCLPLCINIFCTILIVRSLRIRMRTAIQFQPTKTKLKDKISKTKSDGILSCFLPATSGKSNIYSCCCFQIQCRRHTHLRLKVGRTKTYLIKHAEQIESLDRPRASTLTACLSNDNPAQSTARKAPTTPNKKHRTRRTRDLHLSAMLISLNILYLLLNLPFNLHQTFVKGFHKLNTDRCTIMFINLLLDALQQTFFSTNFFLYVLTNRRFREEFYNTFRNILSHCKQKPSIKNANNINQKPRPRTSSCNISTTVIQPNQNSDNQIISVHGSQNRDSIASDIELTETTPIQQQQTKENHELISKLVMFKGLSKN